jgi:hypothetical protein
LIHDICDGVGDQTKRKMQQALDMTLDEAVTMQEFTDILETMLRDSNPRSVRFSNDE